MDKLFGKAPTVKDQLRANDKSLRKVTRDVERDRRFFRIADHGNI